MTSCCFIIIFLIIIFSIIIIYLFIILKNKLTKQEILTNIHQKLEYENKNKQIEIKNNNLENNNNNDEDDDEKEKNYIVFSLINNIPNMQTLKCHSTKCNFTQYDNIQICSNHLINHIKIRSDKSTLKNVTYIHLNKAIIIFITLNEHACVNEQENSPEDLNYITAYISKFMDDKNIIIYKIMMKNNKFILNENFNHLYDTIKISTMNNEIIPTAPPFSLSKNPYEKLAENLKSTTTTTTDSIVEGKFIHIT